MRLITLTFCLGLLTPAAATAAVDRRADVGPGERVARWTVTPQTAAPGPVDPSGACDPATCDDTLVRVTALPAGRTAVLETSLRAFRPVGPNQVELAVLRSDAEGRPGELLNRSFGFLASEEFAPVAVTEGFYLVRTANGGSAATTWTGEARLRLHTSPAARGDADGVRSVRATRSPGAHLEPDLARNPVTFDVLVGVHERYPDPRSRLTSARDVRAAAATATFDGGATWSDLGDFTDLGGGQPRVAFDDEGTAYALTLATGPTVDGLQLRRWRSVSPQDVKDGRTWGPPVVVVGGRELPSAAFGTERGRSAIAVGNAGADGDGRPGPIVACTSDVQTSQPISVVSCAPSSDGGNSFAPPVRVSGTTAYGPDLVADPHDEQTFHLSWIDFSGTGVGFAAEGLDELPSTVSYARSTDGGRSWSVPVVAATVRDHPFTFVHPPVDTLPRLAVGPGGRIHIAVADWQGTGRGRRPDIVVVASQDGRSFDPPETVHTARGASQDVPAIGVAPDGRVDVAFSDRRRDAPTATNDGDWHTDTWLAASGRPGAPWTERRLTRRAHDPQAIAVLRGFFTPNAVSPVSTARALLSDAAGVVVMGSEAVDGVQGAQLVVRRTGPGRERREKRRPPARRRR